MKYRSIAALAACCLFVSGTARSQELDSRQRPFFQPVHPETQVVEELFTIPQDEVRYNFTAAMPGGNYMMISFRRLGDWKQEAFLNGMLAIADHVLEGYNDSLQDERSSKRLDIHVPVNDAPVISRFSAYRGNINLVTESRGERSVLKIGMDTLRMVKNIGIRQGTESELVQVQYTFLLKDIRQLTQIRKDTQYLWRTMAVFDSLVAKQRSVWMRQDAWYHFMYAKYDPGEQNKKKRLQVSTIYDRSNKNAYENNLVNTSANVGALLVRNDLCPNIDVGVTFNLYNGEEECTFARLSTNSFMRFEEQSDHTFKSYATSFVNGEVGVRSNVNSKTVIPFYRVSFGVGYMINPSAKRQDYRDPSMSFRMYKLYFTYGITKAISINTEFISNLKSYNKGYNGWMGIGLMVRLF